MKLKKPLKYQKPVIKTEKLLAFAASCNGSSKGGRKVSTTGPVVFCKAGRLNS